MIDTVDIVWCQIIILITFDELRIHEHIEFVSGSIFHEKKNCRLQE